MLSIPLAGLIVQVIVEPEVGVGVETVVVGVGVLTVVVGVGVPVTGGAATLTTN